MAAVMTGMVSYTKLDVAAPVAVALDAHPELFWLGLPVKIGAIIGMTSVILMSLLGQPRIFMAMSRDGLLPPRLQKVHPKYRTPHVATIVTGLIAASFAGVFPLDVLGELISIGILLAFTAVCAGVLVLRRTQPDTPRPFRVPLAPVHVHRGRGRVPRDDAGIAARHVDPAGRLVCDRCRGLPWATGTGTAGCEPKANALPRVRWRGLRRAGSSRPVR